MREEKEKQERGQEMGGKEREREYASWQKLENDVDVRIDAVGVKEKKINLKVGGQNSLDTK